MVDHRSSKEKTNLRISKIKLESVSLNLDNIFEVRLFSVKVTFTHQHSPLVRLVVSLSYQNLLLSLENTTTIFREHHRHIRQSFSDIKMCRNIRVVFSCGHSNHSCNDCKRGPRWYGRAREGTDDLSILIKPSCNNATTYHKSDVPTRCTRCILTYAWKETTENTTLARKKEALLAILPLSVDSAFDNGQYNDNKDGWQVRNSKDFSTLVSIAQQLDLVLQLRQEICVRKDNEAANLGLDVEGYSKRLRSTKLRDLLIFLAQRIECNLAVQELYLICASSIGIETIETSARACAICRLSFGEAEEEEGLIETPVITLCGHVFGNLCLRTWLKEKTASTCPMCRFDFPAKSRIKEDGEDDFAHILCRSPYNGLADLKQALSSDDPTWKIFLKDDEQIREDFVELFRADPEEQKLCVQPLFEEICHFDVLYKELWKQVVVADSPYITTTEQRGGHFWPITREPTAVPVPDLELTMVGEDMQWVDVEPPTTPDAPLHDEE